MKTKRIRPLLGLVCVLAMGAWIGPAAGGVVWTEGWEDNGTGAVPIDEAFPGVWETDTASVYFYVRLGNESFAVRPAGMTSTTRCAGGATAGNLCGSRSLGQAYTTGTLSIEGWLDARSSDSNVTNYAGLGLDNSSLIGKANPDVWVRYRWNDEEDNGDRIILMVQGAETTFGDAAGTRDPSPTYSNTDPDNYNQWQHVKLEINLYWKAARIYIDTDRSTPGGPWVQLGHDVPLASLGETLAFSHGVTINSRDGGTDDLIVEWVPDNGPPPVFPVTITGTVNPMDYTGDLGMVGVTVELRQGGSVLRTIKTFLNSDGSFSIPDVIQGTYDVAVKGSRWLKKVVGNISATTYPETDLGTIDLISGDNDGNNTVTSNDLSLILDSMDQTGDL